MFMHSASVSCGRPLEKGQRRAPLFRGVVVISPPRLWYPSLPKPMWAGLLAASMGLRGACDRFCGWGGCSLLAACVRCAALLVAIVGGAAGRFSGLRGAADCFSGLRCASVGCAALLWAAVRLSGLRCASVGGSSPQWAALRLSGLRCAFVGGAAGSFSGLRCASGRLRLDALRCRS